MDAPHPAVQGVEALRGGQHLVDGHGFAVADADGDVGSLCGGGIIAPPQSEACPQTVDDIFVRQFAGRVLNAAYQRLCVIEGLLNEESDGLLRYTR